MRYALFVCWWVLLFSPDAFTQTGSEGMKLYDSEAFDIQFSIPENWETHSEEMDGVPVLASESPDRSVVLLIYTFKDLEQSIDDLFGAAVKDLEFKVDGDFGEDEVNGMHALVGEGTGVIDRRAVNFILMSAAHKDTNYLAYIFTDPDKYPNNATMMAKILESFSPLKK